MALQINKPIWNGTLRKRSVGLASYKLGTIDTDVEIMYTRKDGKRSFPHIYTMKTGKIKTYTTQRLPGGVMLYLVPIEDFNVKEERFNL